MVVLAISCRHSSSHVKSLTGYFTSDLMPKLDLTPVRNMKNLINLLPAGRVAGWELEKLSRYLFLYIIVVTQCESVWCHKGTLLLWDTLTSRLSVSDMEGPGMLTK